MRRADRLFRIIQALRGARTPITAQKLAEEFETSLRTIYRDIDELMAQYVPIRGVAGIGYVLEQGYDMPPLMLTPDEIEAAVLGAQWVAARGDPALMRGARDLIAKINAVAPEHLRPMILDSPLMAPNLTPGEPDALDMERVRVWIRMQGKLQIHYRDSGDRDSHRIIWPIAVAYFETVRLIVAWCELRRAFRHFRTDRIKSARFLEEIFPTSTEILRAAWWKERQR
ncbi:MAG: YafY family transcriptional regulator [Betaproteobacteria bacterium]|nr:YafY family transcriptional regulator [Betaproteobacteria bacterium]